jgi:hypothetical protein
MAELGVEPWIVDTVLNHRSGHKSGVAGVYNKRATRRRFATRCFCGRITFDRLLTATT